MLHQIASLRSNAAGCKARFNGRVLPAVLGLGSMVAMQSAGVATAASPTPQSYGLYNTGIDVGGMLGMESVDPEYTIAYEGPQDPLDPGTPLSGSTTYVTNLANALGAPYLPYTPPDNGTSAFISPFPTYSGGQSNLGGEYAITTTFTLTSANFASVSLFGRFESDDRIDNIFVNGVSTGIFLADPDYKAFSAYSNLSSYLQTGLNTITFQLYNFETGSNTDPVALRAEFTNAVPEPSAWAGVASLLGLGLLGRWLLRRRTAAAV